MYHAVHVMDPSEASNANLIVDPDLFEAQIKAFLSKADTIPNARRSLQSLH